VRPPTVPQVSQYPASRIHQPNVLIYARHPLGSGKQTASLSQHCSLNTGQRIEAAEVVSHLIEQAPVLVWSEEPAPQDCRKSQVETGAASDSRYALLWCSPLLLAVSSSNDTLRISPQAHPASREARARLFQSRKHFRVKAAGDVKLFAGTSDTSSLDAAAFLSTAHRNG
jgi:hypothetical protein